MCGIWGYSGNDFNKYKFNILGLYNDSRGGDSCGIVINNNGVKDVKYGFNNNTKLYKNFIEAKNSYDDKDVQFAVGHCRKASVGGIGLDQAQPVVIKDEDGEPIFTMIHNGTLINYKELAAKYNVDFNFNETDSQIFCRIVYKAGYDVLCEYEGAGAFIFWDKRYGEDSIKIFKGASLYYSNDNDLYIERPLYIMEKRNSVWISSIKESLDFINDENLDVKEVECNLLITIKNGRRLDEWEMDRSKMSQVSFLTVNKDKLPKNEVKVYNDYTGLAEEWEEDWYSGRRGSRDYFRESKSNPKTFLGYEAIEKIKAPKTKYLNKIYFGENGLYMCNDRVCDGMYRATAAGYTFEKSTHKSYWFVAGVMMKSYFDYLCANEYILSVLGGDPDALQPIYLAKYSTTPTPLHFEVETENGSSAIESIAFYEHDEKNNDSIEFDGVITPYFSFTHEEYHVADGFVFKWVNYTGSPEYVQDTDSYLLDQKIVNCEIDEFDLSEMIQNNL